MNFRNLFRNLFEDIELVRNIFSKCFYLCNRIFKVKQLPNEKASIPRCQNYQQYAKDYCTKPPICLKCEEGYITYECIKDPNLSTTFYLSGGSHPVANCKGCEVYINTK